MTVKKLKGILITSISTFENHTANGAENKFKNHTTFKQTCRNEAYVSGQMQRHVLANTISELNDCEPNKKETYVSNSNGTGGTDSIKKDLRADLLGLLNLSKESLAEKRVSPIKVTPAISLNEAEITTDLLTNYQVNSKENMLANKDISRSDKMLMNFFLNIGEVGITKNFKYDNSIHIDTEYVQHIDETERKRRARLFLEATKSLNGYANQSRNAIAAEPEDVLIIFLYEKQNMKGMRYFKSNEQVRKNILEELKDNGADVFIGCDDSTNSVNSAYKAALNKLSELEIFNPTK